MRTTSSENGFKGRQGNILNYCFLFVKAFENTHTLGKEKYGGWDSIVIISEMAIWFAICISLKTTAIKFSNCVKICFCLYWNDLSSALVKLDY